jgi:hypothetical protein
VKIKKLSRRKKRSSHQDHEPDRRNRSGIDARMEITRLIMGPPMAAESPADKLMSPNLASITTRNAGAVLAALLGCYYR